MYIIVNNRIDRLGANFISKISQIIYAFKNNRIIKFEYDYIKEKNICKCPIWNDKNQLNLNSIYNKILIEIIKDHNKEMYNQKIDDKELDCFFNINTNDYNNHINLNKIQIDTILNIKQDLFSYFIENIKKKYLEKLEN